MSPTQDDRVRSALTPLFVTSLLVAVGAFVVAERIFKDPTPRLALNGLAALCVVAIGILAVRARALLPAEGRVFGTGYLIAFLLLATGGGLYAGHVFLGSTPDGSPLWLLGASAALGGGLLTATMVDLTRVSMREAGFVDVNRVREALLVAAIITLALAGLGFLNYAAVQREFRRDYAIGGSHRPSDATIHLIRSSATPVEVLLFFEDNAPALNVVRDYFDGLKEVGTQVRVVDAALEVALADELKVTQNGTVVVRAGERSERWVLGRKAESVQRKLDKLDEEVSKRLAKLGGEPTVVYFSVGHGERSYTRAKSDERVGAETFKRLIEATNAKVKSLGLGEGLADKIPDDATLVVVAGPTQPFLPAEVDALKRYLEGGGSLFLLLDPATTHGLDSLLVEVGVDQSGQLANDREFVRESNSNADHNQLFATSFANHPTVKALYDTRGKAALRFRGASSINKREGADVTGVARTRKDTFEDRDGDRIYTEGTDGARGVSDFVVAIEKTYEGAPQAARLVIAGDSDVITDDLIRDPRDANGAFGYLSTLWLERDDAQIDSITAPKQDPMSQTAEEASAWFYVSTVFVPVLLLIVGVVYPRSRRRRRK